MHGLQFSYETLRVCARAQVAKTTPELEQRNLFWGDFRNLVAECITSEALGTCGLTYSKVITVPQKCNQV